MTLYRITVRHGRPQQYIVEDVEADTLADAMRHAADRISATAEPDADLAEFRVQMDPESRRYAGT